MIHWASEILEDGQWRDSPAFIIGGGPSLEGFDFEQLRGGPWKTLGVNAAYSLDPDIVFVSDAETLGLFERDPVWGEISSVKLTHASNENELTKRKFSGEGVYFVPILHKRPEWGTHIKDGIAVGNNGGTFALNIADILGADPIFLLGYDLKGRPGEPAGRAAQWHRKYPDEWQGRGPYERFKEDLETWAPKVRAKVFNLNPDSALECFEKISFEEAVLALQK